MNDLNWLTTHRIAEVNRQEYQWTLVFDRGANATIECAWRLIEQGRIRLTNADDGQKFGLPAHIDAEHELRQRLVGAIITGVTLKDGTLDLDLRLSNGHVLQIIPNSSGYEAWTFGNATHLFVAVGGGELAVWGPRASDG